MNRIFVFMAALAAMISCDRTLDLVLLSEEKLEQSAKEYKADPDRAEFVKLFNDADSILTLELRSVVEKSVVPPSGDKHDYLSQGPYWWPNPNTPDGLPYVRRDGEGNPEINDISDAKYMKCLMEDVSRLAEAYYLSKDEKYASKAAEIIRVWFLNPDTKMNPNMQYAQMVPGVYENGRGIGIIDISTRITVMYDNVRILEHSRSWTDDDDSALKAWVSEFVGWLTTSDNGMSERSQPNNHGTYYELLVCTSYLFIGDVTSAAENAKEGMPKRFDEISASGATPRELSRTKSWSYSLMNLKGLLYCALAAEKAGVDMWHYTNIHGATIQTALDWYKPYILEGKAWDYKDIHNQFNPIGIVPILQIASGHCDISSYSDFIANPQTKTQCSGLIGDALEYQKNPSDSLRDKFNQKYLTVRPGSSLVDIPHPLYPDSTYYGDNRLDDNILPLAFGIVPDSLRETVVQNVIARIRNAKYKVKLCPEVEPYFLKTLYENGWNKYAYFICDEHPEMVTNQSIDSEYVREWREQCLAGITETDGILSLKPDFSIEELDSLDVTVSTSVGTVRSSFTKDLMHAEWYFTIPRGIRAEISVPVTHRKQVKLRCLARKLRTEGNCTVWRVRGGKHHMSIDFELPEYVVEQQFVYKNEDFPQCHSSTLCFAENGDLVAAFYGGTEEHNPDTKVRVCRKEAGSDSWTRPVAVAEPDKERYCLDNPVLFRIPEPGEPMLLFYKIRPGFHIQEDGIDIRTIYYWEARLKRSYDNGKTWTEAEALPDGFLGPIKDKPVYRDGRMICGSSFEAKYHHEGTRIHFEWTDDKCKTWHYCEPDSVQKVIPCELRAKGRVGENKDVPENPNYYYGNWNPIFSIQPTILIHKDGSLQALCRTNCGKMSTTWSHDNGASWSCETLTDMPQNGSGIDATTLPDGRFALVYNEFETLPGHNGGPRSPLKLAVSEDGIHWTNLITLEDDCIKEYSYPAIIADQDGYLHITYTWRRYRVKYVKVKI